MARARILRLLFSLALAFLAVVLGGVSVLRKVSTFQPLGFEGAAPHGSAVEVTRVTDPATGLRAGDQIVLVNGSEIRSADSLVLRLREAAKSTLVVQRGPEPLKVTYLRPALDPDWTYLILALVGVAYLGIGLYTLLRQGSGQGLLFYLWCFTSATLFLLTATPPQDAAFKLIDLVDTAALVLLPAITLHFFLIFPVPAPLPLPVSVRFRRLRLAHLVPFVYLPAAVLLALGLDMRLTRGRLFFGPPTEESVRLLDRLQLAHFGLVILGAVALLVVRLRRERGWEQHRQMQWVALGLAGGYLPFLFCYGLPVLLRWQPSKALTLASVAPLVLVPLAFAYAILRYKLWDIEVVVRDTISSTLTLLLGIIGFALANQAISRGVSEELALARNLLTFASGLGIAAMLVPARSGISSALERVHYRGSFGKRRALAGLGPELLHDRDLSGLCDALVRRLEEGIDIPLSALYLAQEETMVAVRGPREIPPRLSVRAFGDAFWERDFVRLHGLSLPTQPLEGSTLLFAAGFRYALPLVVRGRAIGVVACGLKRNQAQLSSEDVELLRSFLDPASLALENAQLLSQLQVRLDEVRRLQDYSEGIFESSPAGIAVLDDERRLVSANHAFARMVGQEPETLLGLDLLSVLPVLPLPAPGEAPIEVSYSQLGAEEPRERHLQLSLAPFEDGERSGHSVLVVHDVSERVAMESKLREKERLAALGVLAAGVAHEVNTPITGISSYAQMLLSETPEDDPRHELLRKVERQTFRAARIVNNLLEYARDKPREQRPLDLVPILAESLDLLSERFAKRGIELDWTPPAAPVEVRGSEGELNQVFTNLIVNALDAMHEHGGRLSIRIEPGAEKITLRFTDSGPGIAPEKLATIFQPFYSTKLNRGGTGLGLAISHDIVRRHGGDLRVESRLGEGACFTVDLPRLSASPQLPAPASPA